jgi:hypothetical protein
VFHCSGKKGVHVCQCLKHEISPGRKARAQQFRVWGVSRCRVADGDIQALNVRVATALSTKLVKAIRKFLKQLNSALVTNFTTAFEEEGGVRRAWNSDLGEDAERAQKECVLALAQLILVPQGLSVPGATEDVFKQSQVCLATCGARVA